MDIEADRLSNLPDHLIHNILSFIDIKDTVKTSVLSSRWRYIWTSIPYLNFEEETRYSTSDNVTSDNVLSGRNNQIDVYSVNYSTWESHPSEMPVKTIMEYAFSHNVQQLNITSMFHHAFQFPLNLFSSSTLKHLALIGSTIDNSDSPTSTWDLQNLTTLHLDHVRLIDCNPLFVMCHNLKNLTLTRCKVTERGNSNGFSIVNSSLLNLSLKKVEWYVDFVLVDTPQLKNLIFVDTRQPPREHCLKSISFREVPGGLTISAPDLAYLLLKGSHFPKLSLDGFNSLEKVDIRISSPHKTDVDKIYDLLQHLNSVKFLALSLEVVELLSSSVDINSPQPSPFTSLKSLKIYPTQTDQEEATKEINISTEVHNYLLDNSPNATFTMVSHEEARAIKSTKMAYRLMAQLQKELEKTDAYELKAEVEDEDPDKDPSKGMMTYDNSFRIGMVIRGNYYGGRHPRDIIITLYRIKKLLTKVVTSKRVEMQACYSSLCAEAKTVTDKIIDAMKTQCEIRRSIFHHYLNEFACSS